MGFTGTVLPTLKIPAVNSHTLSGPESCFRSKIKSSKGAIISQKEQEFSKRVRNSEKLKGTLRKKEECSGLFKNILKLTRRQEVSKRNGLEKKAGLSGVFEKKSEIQCDF